MLNAIFFIGVLCIIDLSLITLMPRFYINFGIPLYVKTVPLKAGKGLEDITGFVRLTEGLKYKVEGDSIIYRTKFNIIHLYTLLFISIVKGELSLKENKLKIVQRMNLTTTFFICFMIYIALTQELDNFGKISMIAVTAVIIAVQILRNNGIREIKNDIEKSLGAGESI